MTISQGAAVEHEPSVPVTERRFRVPFILITSLFFLWAFGVNLNDILIPHLKKAFGLTDFQSSFIQVAFFGGYFLAAFPAGRLMEKIGYKKGILAGLFLCAVGAVLFVPASSSRVYSFFLFALFVMASGQSFLEVAANPYVTILGPAASAERRLNFAQSFNAVGAVLSPLVGRAFILTDVVAPSQIAAMSAGQLAAYRAAEASTVKGPYLIIAGIFVVVAVLIQLAHLPDVQDAPAEADMATPEPNTASVLSHPHLVKGAPGDGCDRSVFLRGRAGGCAKLCHSLRAVGRSRNSSKNGRAVFAAPPDRIHDRPLRRFSHHEEDCRAAPVVAFRRRVAALCCRCFAGFRPDSGCSRRAYRILPLHHVPHDLCAEHQGPRFANQTWFIPSRHGNYRRRVFPGDHGAYFGCVEHPEGIRRAHVVLRVHPLFWLVRI